MNKSKIHMESYLFLKLFVISICTDLSDSHGYLISPPGRGSAWRVGFKTPINYDDMSQICRRWCTPCGLPMNEAGGRYATNTIVANYRSGQKIVVKLRITANHLGDFYFKLCTNGNSVTEDCFKSNPLQVYGGNHTFKYDIPRAGSQDFDVELGLPINVYCNHCVLRWHWNAKNTGEKFRNCADISIS